MIKNFNHIKKFEKNIYHGFFTCMGGVSKNNYLSLNCNKNSKDNKKNIKKNIFIALKNLGIKNKKIVFINQIHSDKIFLINNKNYKDNFYGDGIITKEKELALAVLTADCAPIFIFDNQKNFVSCLHAGWKGALNNISAKCIKKLNKKNIKIKNIIAIVGPCLGLMNFEVDKKFKFKFISKNNSYMRFFKYKNKHKDLFDLRGLLNFQLKEEGLKNIYNIKRDTYKNSKMFFSHRRATHLKQGATGRMINIISLKD